jgi:hypothetical protein
VPQTPRFSPADLMEASTRAEHVRQIIATFPNVTRVWTDLLRQVNDVLRDVPALTAEIVSLGDRLSVCRMSRANLAAAARVTITAYLSGEKDPLACLLDELHAQGFGDGRGEA